MLAQFKNTLAVKLICLVEWVITKAHSKSKRMIYFIWSIGMEHTVNHIPYGMFLHRKVYGVGKTFTG